MLLIAAVGAPSLSMPDTNTVERAIRPIALGRKNSLFAGSDGGARHWALVASLVATAKLNGVEPLAWLTDVLERMVSGRTKAHELERLLPWAWKAERLAAASMPEGHNGQTTLALEQLLPWSSKTAQL